LNAGCIVVSEKLPVLDIYRDVPVIQINSWKEGLKKIDEILSDRNLLQKLHVESIQWWENNCTYPAVAKRISGLIEK
jgi:hypothetical protein